MNPTETNTSGSSVALQHASQSTTIPDLCPALSREFDELRLHRPRRRERYTEGEVLTYSIFCIGADECRVRLRVEKFVGGGFAGQVYRVRVDEVTGGANVPIQSGNRYALKIFIPPSGFSTLFRNALYRIGFQGAFQIQVNPAAARAGALWQKFIRRAARIHFGTESAVNNVYGTFVDTQLGSCGELSDWIDGRTWVLEVDDRLDLLRRFHHGKPVAPAHLGSPEYRAKKTFMSEFVSLLHTVGAHEFARQYEWSTWKSQPNCLKRLETDDAPDKGLVAVDFRAGLVLLPFLPMSPGDVLLIVKGLLRGSLVQFDRGDITRLESYVNAHSLAFRDMYELLPQLKKAEEEYRDSLLDITHNHIRWLYNSRFRRTLHRNTVQGWHIRNFCDNDHAQKLSSSALKTLLFWAVGMVPFAGRVLRKWWGHKAWRSHYSLLCTSFDYVKRTLRGKVLESTSLWIQQERCTEQIASKILHSFPLFCTHTICSPLPAGLHRFVTDWGFFKEKIHDIAVYPIELYFNAAKREQWLRDMVEQGKQDRIISHDDAQIILNRIHEPFIQKYLKSLAVHVCTAPVTQIVSVAIALIAVLTHPEWSRAEASAYALAIIAAFQIVPLSPGSLTRGLYVLYLVIKERNFKDYNIAVFLAFFKYVGYLAFPIQMTYRYPTLARFMAAHWATEAVHIVPVFGERGALLEHRVFSLFYNEPLTIRRRMRARAEARSSQKPRYWHGFLTATGSTALLVSADFLLIQSHQALPTLRELVLTGAPIALLGGALMTLFAGGASMWKRIIPSVLFGIAAPLLSTILLAGYLAPFEFTANTAVSLAVWRSFIAALFSPAGVMLTEILLPDPGEYGRVGRD